MYESDNASTTTTTTTMTETLDCDPTTTTTEKKQKVRSDAIRVVQTLRFCTTQYDYVRFGWSLIRTPYSTPFTEMRINNPLTLFWVVVMGKIIHTQRRAICSYSTVHNSKMEGLECLRENLTSDTLLPWMIENFQGFYATGRTQWKRAVFTVLVQLLLLSYLPLIYDVYSDIVLANQYLNYGKFSKEVSLIQIKTLYWTKRTEAVFLKCWVSPWN